MTFTDDDLKRLKDLRALDFSGMKDGFLHYPKESIDALLARLEAAEAVCQSVIDNGDEPNFKFSMKAWHKAAGK